MTRRGLLAFCAAVATGELASRPMRALAAVGHRFVVTEFGARGDGSTDDTDAIHACISAAYDSGDGVVYMPPGTYKINGLKGVGVRKKPVKLLGAGADKTALTWFMPDVMP